MTHKKITSTELKQNMREKLNEIAALREPHVVYTYGEPKVVIISYQDWVEQNRKLHDDKTNRLRRKRLTALGKYQFSGPKIDSSAMIRKMRDSEGQG